MYCFQCQETIGNKGCTKVGACGKTDKVASLQDLLIYVVKGISNLNQIARKKGINEKETEDFIIDSLFTTITNANFNDAAISKKIKNGLKIREELKEKLDMDFSLHHDAINWKAKEEDFLEKARTVGVMAEPDEDIRSLKELITYGLKGMAAYYQHASNLGYSDSDIVDFTEMALAFTLQKQNLNDCLDMTMKTGEYCVKAMAILDKANTSTYGSPEISTVNLDVGKNPGILVSGHDLNDIKQLLDQTIDSGVDVYTHGEMLPAHYYPELKKYPHLVGNYGGSWWKQKKEFEQFNGPILFTTNCIVPPKKDMVSKIFTTGSSGFPGCTHIEEVDGKKDFSEIIEMAKTCPPPKSIEIGTIVGGFAHDQVMALADKVVENIKNGSIKKFVVMGGCDGRHKGRNYYTEFAEKLPKDTIILTSGCAKYRYNKLNLGDINGIPRVLDAGQCNDSYSLALIALKLKEVFELDDINDLPIFYNIAWYEQKAITVFLGLLSLGVKNIHLGPTIPGFLSENTVKVLVENFGIAKNGDVDEDIEKFILN